MPLGSSKGMNIIGIIVAESAPLKFEGSPLGLIVSHSYSDHQNLGYLGKRPSSTYRIDTNFYLLCKCKLRYLCSLPRLSHLCVLSLFQSPDNLTRTRLVVDTPPSNITGCIVAGGSSILFVAYALVMAFETGPHLYSNEGN